MRLLFIFILTTITCVSLNAQTLANNSDPYDYDTILKGGYRISFRMDD